MEKIWNKINIAKISSVIILLILFLIPFQGFITVWPSSIFGHYTLFRLWKEFLLVIILLISIYYLISDLNIRKIIFSNKLSWLIIGFLGIEVLWAIVAYFNKDVSTKALFFGLLLDCRYFIFFGITWIIALKNRDLVKFIPKIILVPAMIVVFFGLAQIFILPHNFLAHFGYNSKTILPFQTINSNSKYIRIISTTRGANPLGAYLIIPISYLIYVFLRKFKKINGQKIKIAIFTLLSLFVLFFSFSRSAWIGAFVAGCIIVFFSIRNKKTRSRILIFGIAILIVLSLGLFIERNNHKIQNLLFHTQANSKIKVSSDQAHLSATLNNLKETIKNPLGSGPGSSGPASFYNKDSIARIPENYYIQIAQEVGVVGLIIYLAIIIKIIVDLSRHKFSNKYSLFLVASLIGISVTNFFLMAWTDDTLAYLWWGLLGISYASFSYPKSTVLKITKS